MWQVFYFCCRAIATYRYADMHSTWQLPLYSTDLSLKLGLRLLKYGVGCIIDSDRLSPPQLLSIPKPSRQSLISESNSLYSYKNYSEW